MRHSWNVPSDGFEVEPVETSDEQGADGCGSDRDNDPEALELSFDLENDPALIPGVLARIIESAERLRLFDDATTPRVSLALHEAMINGIHHGNLELDSDLRLGDERAYQRLASRRSRMARFRKRRLHIVARFDTAGAVFVIRDDGHGFDPNRLPDPTDPASLEKPSGRGLLLIRAFMDEVSYNATGNQITLVKRPTEAIPRSGRG